MLLIILVIIILIIVWSNASSASQARARENKAREQDKFEREIDEGARAEHARIRREDPSSIEAKMEFDEFRYQYKQRRIKERNEEMIKWGVIIAAVGFIILVIGAIIDSVSSQTFAMINHALLFPWWD